MRTFLSIELRKLVTGFDGVSGYADLCIVRTTRMSFKQEILARNFKFKTRFSGSPTHVETRLNEYLKTEQIGVLPHSSLGDKKVFIKGCSGEIQYDTPFVLVFIRRIKFDGESSDLGDVIAEIAIGTVFKHEFDWITSDFIDLRISDSWYPKNTPTSMVTPETTVEIVTKLFKLGFDSVAPPPIDVSDINPYKRDKFKEAVEDTRKSLLSKNGEEPDDTWLGRIFK